ncbi:hypothetical protein [Hyalangium minutum]|uniref:Uncharacterized protein n=1 Tax=Hyalangium minutum TaxID=394096 RepID=A0A085VZB8_9BACT|nr:hypothetical protein [Hyalangium minutum]KFE60781.1 hypothetical protein DB31_4694 [Hyalangium minutum]
MRRDYRDWLRSQGYDDGTINNQLYRVARVEEHYGELDGHYDSDRMETLIEQLTYSTEDQRRGRPNPSKLPFIGNVRNNLASYKSAVLWYRRFRGSGTVAPSSTSPSQPSTASPLLAAAAASESWPPRRTEPKALEPRVGPRTLVDFRLDGHTALEAIIASSQYRTVAQAVASLSLFSHPQTVRQTGGKALFPAIRNPRRVGQIDEHEGRRVLLDDNKSPTDAFLWANGLNRRGRDTQFNHVYAASLDADAYTALPNICMTPAFIAKLTDTSDEVCRLLRYRSYQLYQWVPAGHTPPERPEEYEALEWAAPLLPVEDVRSTMVGAMARKPKNRTVVAARELGWLFG